MGQEAQGEGEGEAVSVVEGLMGEKKIQEHNEEKIWRIMTSLIARAIVVPSESIVSASWKAASFQKITWSGCRVVTN